MGNKKASIFAETLRIKAQEALKGARSDEDMLYPLALAVARRQMKQWWLKPVPLRTASSM